MALKPAILYKEKIIKGMQEYFYTDDMLYETGCMDNWIPEIYNSPSEGCYQWAIVNSKEELIGFLCYKIDFYSSRVYNFGLFSFDRGNPLVGREVYRKMEELVQDFHRVEWRGGRWQSRM